MGCESLVECEDSELTCGHEYGTRVFGQLEVWQIRCKLNSDLWVVAGLGVSYSSRHRRHGLTQALKYWLRIL